MRAGPSPAQRAVVWHDLECGGYRVDLQAWLELAERAGGPVLDVGAGTGRVSLALARAKLGEAAFADAWTEGLSMPLEAAVEEALALGPSYSGTR